MALLSTERISWLRHHPRLSHGVIALVWAVLFSISFLVPGPIQRELMQIDIHFADILDLHGRWTSPNPDIVFLGIDTASRQLDMLDPDFVSKDPVLSLMAKDWPWNRKVHAAVLDKLINAGARVVIFDLLFLHPTDDDPVFKAALDRAADRVVVGCNRADYDRSLQLPSDSLIPQTLPFDPRIAYVNFQPDGDGVIRKASFHFTYLGPSIGQAQSDYVIDSTAAKVAKILGRENLVPKDGDDHWFRFTGIPGETFKTYSIYKLFNPPDWENLFQNGAFFKDKIVMIGPQGNFQQDLHSTPLGGMDGSEIHLQSLNALLHGEFLFYTGVSRLWLIGLVALSGFVAWLLGIMMQKINVKSALLSSALAVTFCAAYFFWGLNLYSQGIILAVAAPLGTLSFTLVSSLGGQYFLEQMERTRTRQTLERYVSPKIVRELLDNPNEFYESLSGQRRQVTVLFSDLRGFTSMTENADSQQLVRELNEYLQEMTKALFQHEGILDKFIGDAVMAMWGSLHPLPELDARHAVLAALAMHRELAALNVRRRERGLKDFAMGVGINHGEAIVGNIGSEQQMNFTVIGDSVNLASRLEGTTKEYGVPVLISETVEELVRPYFHLQTVDSIVVKGRAKPVMTYTVLGLKEEPLPATQSAYLEKFEEAMRLYRTEKFQQAREGFAACLAINPEDKLSSIFVERSEEFAANPPPQPWDGSYTMKTK